MAIKYKFFGLECEIDRELSDYSGIEKSLKELGWEFEAINFVNQVHSREVVVIDSKDKILPRQGLPKVDGIVTNLKKLAVGVITADCSPVILKDEKNSVLGVVHSGWRGAKLGIIFKAVDKMKEIGAEIGEIKALIGPMIHQKSYQVSREFYDDFLSQDEEFVKFFVNDDENDKFLFDLVGFVEDRLRDSGVLNIENLDINTYENYQQYASYRKACHLNKESGGRNISIAMID